MTLRPLHPAVRDTGIVVAAACVVMIAGWVPSLWTDEAATVSAATRSWSDLWAMLHHLDAVHGLYYAVMHVWTAVAGTSEVALRVPSAAAVGLATLGTVRLVTELGRRDLAPVAGVVVVLLPRIAWSGIEARPFAAAMAVGVWMTLLAVRAWRDGGLRSWAGYAALAVLGVLLNLYVVLLVVAHGVALAVVGRAGAVRRWAAAAAAVAATTAPFAFVVAGQGGQLGRVDPSVSFLARNVVVNQWFVGETPTRYVRGEVATQLDLSSSWQVAAVLLALVAGTVMVVAVLREPRSELVVWAASTVLVPTVALVVWALVSGTYSPRYATFTAPGAAVLVAVGLRGIRLRRWTAAVMVVAALPVLVSQRIPDAKSGSDWRWVSQVVEEHTGPGDAVYFSPRSPASDGLIGLTTRGVSVAYPGPFTDLDDLTLQTSAAQAENLTGWSVPLDQVDLSDVQSLVVIRRLDYPGASADDALLAQAGLHVEQRWTGSLDEIVLCGR